jgi:central glycolytic genes regulator
VGLGMAKGEFDLENLIKLQQKFVPEAFKLLEKRYSILKVIYYKHPIGRRVLSNELEIGERVVRSEINFLKDQNFIKVDALGMTITKEGKEIIEKLSDVIHELKGLSELEKSIKEKLKVSDVIIVPGDVKKDSTVLSELGKAAAIYIKKCIKNGSIIALTGGTTVKEVVSNTSKTINFKNVLIVPARGGIGRNVETQANTLVEDFAKKINANYKLMHVPDNLSDEAVKTLLKEKDVSETIEKVRNADIIVFGIGIAGTMAVKRGCSVKEVEDILHKGAVGEAFGCYFDIDGNVIHSNPTIGIKKDEIDKIKNVIAVAGGKDKAKAIIAVGRQVGSAVIITDEGAAIEIINLLK